MPIQQFNNMSAHYRATSNFHKPEPWKHFPAIELVVTVYNESNQNLTETKIVSVGIICGSSACETEDQATQQATVWLSANYVRIAQEGMKCVTEPVP